MGSQFFPPSVERFGLPKLLMTYIRIASSKSRKEKAPSPQQGSQFQVRDPFQSWPPLSWLAPITAPVLGDEPMPWNAVIWRSSLRGVQVTPLSSDVAKPPSPLE